MLKTKIAELKQVIELVQTSVNHLSIPRKKAKIHLARRASCVGESFAYECTLCKPMNWSCVSHASREYVSFIRCGSNEYSLKLLLLFANTRLSSSHESRLRRLPPFQSRSHAQSIP